LSRDEVAQTAQQAQPERARVTAPSMSLGGASSSQSEQARLEREREAREEAPRRDVAHEAPSTSHVPAHAEHAHRAASAARDDERDRAFDPRHPEHPDHKMYLSAREKVAALYEEHGIPMSEDKLERTTAAVLSDAREQRMTKIEEIEFTVTKQHGIVPDPNGHLVVWSHAREDRVREPWYKSSMTDTQTIDQRDPDRDYTRFREETIKEEKSLAEFYKQQEEINKNQDGPVMRIGPRSLSSDTNSSDGGDGGGGGE
jgi:hypothetical protein